MISQKPKKEVVSSQKEMAQKILRSILPNNPTDAEENRTAMNLATETQHEVLLHDESSPVSKKLSELEKMFTQFMETSIHDRNSLKKGMEDMRASINSKTRDSPRESVETPIANRYEDNRRSSMFFGSPHHSPPYQPQIQILQSDIVYNREVQHSSLEGLQHLSKQLQIMSSKYPGREIQIGHMIAPSLRHHIIAAWNTYTYKEYMITGIEVRQLIIEDWLTLSNSSVQQMLLESARPRTRELFCSSLVSFLSKGIPKSPPVNTDNFSKLFYLPLIKSLNDIVQLYALLSEETSNYSDNRSKMPDPGYGTRENPGQIALWLISLGSQKEAIQQWLGIDNLRKYKTIDTAAKYIRTKLMEARALSESRQDLDSKFTPMRYDDILHTTGESYTRQQINLPSYHTPDNGKSHSHQNHFKPSFSAIDVQHDADDSNTDNSNAENSNEINNNTAEYDEYSDHLIDDNDEPADLDYLQPQECDTQDYTLQQMETSSMRNSIAATFRGYCSEQFVFGKCLKNSACTFDHSTKGQEICQQSFLLLAKRDLTQHGNLPPYKNPNVNKDPFQPNKSSRPNAHQQPIKSNNFSQPFRPNNAPASTRPYVQPTSNSNRFTSK